MFGSGSRYPSVEKIILTTLLMGGFLFAQEQKGSGSFPLLEKPKPNYGLLIPEEKAEDYSFLNKSNEDNRSMTKKEQFIDPGKKYLKKLSKEGSISKDTYLGDMYLGDVFTLSKNAQILLRDFGQEDGDRVRIFVNDEEVVPNIFLKNQFFALKLPLKEGFNKLEFQALNQGKLYPNTAELRIYDDFGVPLITNQWNLSKGAKATLIIVKERNKLLKE